ncbi:DUF58 domain-containing protein [Paracoccus aestuariivivens]|uniref:DUF58 domain-containing protein n=2 Tax=Paracoccus aestuariivivens TaxID=1820333 RepID=A0A6L6JA42_9RHOB|nr:DUF58 domain-containing protein [Paracoccus aestuariivivens]MTH77978.1 DUF58 domain-containing protein [Paracoccus aestuariivivens]
MDLREIRAFSDGDDPRRLDPAATARTGQLHVRSFHEERDDTTLLIADFRRPMLWGTGHALRSVLVARHLARLGWRAVSRGGSVGLLVATDEANARLSPAIGEAQMQQICRLLARTHDAALIRNSTKDQPSPIALTAVLAQGRQTVAAVGRIHLVTGPDALVGCDGTLTQLSRGRQVEIHLVLDPVEIAPPRHALTVSSVHASRHGNLAAYDAHPVMAHLRKLGAKPHLVLPDDLG